MVTNAEAVIYNEHNGEYHTTQLGRVMWQDISTVAVTGKEYNFTNADTIIFIPRETIDGVPGEYLPPSEYAELDDPRGYWTVTPGHDFISRGNAAYDVTQDEHSYLKTVTSAAFNDFGSRNMQHIEVAAI